MLQEELNSFVQSERGAMRLGWLVLGTGLFAGLGLTPRPDDQLSAQEVAISAPVPAGPVAGHDRQRLEQALQGMDAAELSLAYARIHASFRALLAHEDLGAARALVDYAALAEAEMHRRRIARPEGTESAQEMLLLYELVL